MSSKFYLFLFVIFLLVRVVGLNWGDGYYFHPDENNMAQAITRLSLSDLNPHFFAYGQFPLYLSFFSLYPFFGDQPPMLAATLSLRLISFFFSLLFFFLAFKLSKILFSKNFERQVFLLLLTFHSGLIQIAHFGTTESILATVFIGNLYFLLKIKNNPHFIYFIFAAINSAIGLGSKITALFFIWPIFIIGLFKRKYLNTAIFAFLSLFLFLLFTPYSFLNFNDFLSAMRYETGVATGTISVFYTRQFIDSVPLLFQLTKILPFVSGLFMFIFSIFGFYNFVKTKKVSKDHWLFIIPSLIYFIYFSFTFTRWTRFLAPVFFLTPYFATFFISRYKIGLRRLFLFLACLPSLFFIIPYFFSDIRLQATKWINTALPPSSVIFTESGNVVDLPVDPDYKVINFDFYTLDFNQANKNQLAESIFTADYVIIPSRRVFKNQTSPNFPDSALYYQRLFDGSLGFVKIKQFNFPYLFLDPENAEETFSVFDRPTIRIYQKINQLSVPEIKKLIIHES